MNIEEILKALLAGETIVNKAGYEFAIENGVLTCNRGQGLPLLFPIPFGAPENVQIKSAYRPPIEALLWVAEFPDARYCVAKSGRGYSPISGLFTVFPEDLKDDLWKCRSETR